MTVLLRWIAYAIPVIALFDPAVSVPRELRLPVSLRVDAADPDALAIAATLKTQARDWVTVDDGSEAPSAVVVVGDSASPDVIARDVPISTVSLETSPNVAISDAPASVTLRTGSSIDLEIELHGRGMVGQTSTLVLEEGETELARVEHKWLLDGRALVRVPYLGIRRGVSHVAARVLPHLGERRIHDNRASVRIVTTDQQWKIAVLEPRPSWPVTFLRRVLEADSAFTVSSLSHFSRGVVLRAGSESRALSARQLSEFDVVLVGAPEELSVQDTDALRQFASSRGGTVVLLPDRRPVGAYVDWLPGGVSERLLQAPRPLRPSGMRCSEVVTLRDAVAAVSLADTDSGESVITWWPVGEGRLLFSGALDAWRFRGDTSAAFARFWLATVEAAASAAPPRVKVLLNRGVARPGESAMIRVRLRPSEIRKDNDRLQLPKVSARLVSDGGHAEMIRLWPTVEAGSFEATVALPRAGHYVLKVSTVGGDSTETTLAVAPDAARPSTPSMWPFVSALGADWILRRRAGAK